MSNRVVLLLLVLGAGITLAVVLVRRDIPGDDAVSEAPVEQTTLSEAERSRLWSIENHAGQLSTYGWSKFSVALADADRDALDSLISPTLQGRLSDRHSESTPEFWSAIKWSTVAGDSINADADRFLDWLLNLRARFDGQPSVSVEQLSIGPEAVASFEGEWSGKIRLRLRGERADGGVMETLVVSRCTTSQPDREILSDGQWLLSWQLESVTSVRSDRPLMADVTEGSGLRTDTLHDNWTLPQSGRVVSTGGIYLSDFNRDGCLDVLVTDINPQHPTFLYAGQSDGTFRDVTRESLLPAISETTQAVWADLDGDGWDDLVFPGVAMFRNHNGERFIDMSALTTLDAAIRQVGLEGITGVSVVDYDRDGRVDLYVTRCDSTNFNRGSWIDGVSGNPPRNQLLRNLGGGQFEDVTQQANASGGRRSVFTAQWLDVNDDAWPDLYVIHEFGAGVLLVNQRDGTFTEHQVAPSESSDFGSMGHAVGDVNNDGRIDLYVSNMYSKAGNRVMDNIPDGCHSDETLLKLRKMVSGSQLHLNHGDLEFSQAGDDMGVAQVGWSWGAAMADLNNDGWLDIHATAGFMSHDRKEPDG